MKETFFMAPEGLYDELQYYLAKKDYRMKDFEKVESPEDIYIFQPAFVEVFERLLFELSKEKLKQLVPQIQDFIKNAPYNIENKEEILWALELWKESPDVSFTKTLNAAKARSHRIHSVIK